MHTNHPHDEAFQRAVLRAAESMDLPPYAGERLHQAMDLVLTGSVTLNGNGSATVKSGSHTYQIDALEGCTCADSRNRSRQCKHTLAVGLLQRARALMDEAGDGSEPAPPAAGAADVPQPAAWQCAQAPSSCTMKWHLAGIELLLTIRASNDADLFSRIKHILPKIQEKVAHNGNGQTPAAEQCLIHNVPMKRYSKGEQSWFSHQTPDGDWCRGR